MPQAGSPPLSGLRVLELATGIAGPYAGRLLALLGADVVKLEPAGGDPTRAQRVDDRPLAGASPLFLHLGAGKRCEPRERADLPALLAWAQVTIDDRVRAELDPASVLGAGPAPRVLASVTPWGFEAPAGGGIADELLAQAHVIPGTVRPADWTLQCQVYGRPERIDDPRFDRRNRLRNHAELRALLQPWYDARGKHEIFRAALDAGWAAAMILTARDVLDDEHLRERGFLCEVAHRGRRVVVPAAPWRGEGLPCARARVSDGADDEEVRELLRSGAARAALPPLAGVRVLELTRAWAGPFVGRFFGACGADVIKLEAARSPDGWRARLRWRDAGVAIPPSADPDAFTWDAAALYNGLNRNKRGLSLDLTRPGARELVLRIVESTDIVVVNMTHRVLADFGLEYEVLARANPRLVLVKMPALGASGPYRAMPGYGMLIEGMGGFAARFGDRGEPARASAPAAAARSTCRSRRPRGCCPARASRSRRSKAAIPIAWATRSPAAGHPASTRPPTAGSRSSCATTPSARASSRRPAARSMRSPAVASASAKRSMRTSRAGRDRESPPTSSASCAPAASARAPSGTSAATRPRPSSPPSRRSSRSSIP